MPSYWLLKTEPGTYSFQQLVKDKKTTWNGIRNYQARNNLSAMAKGDIALIYHTGNDKAVVGIAEITQPGHPDVDEDGEEWVQVEIKAVKPLKKTVPLTQIKKSPELKDLQLVTHSRLSVMPVKPGHYQRILKMGGL